MKHHLQGYLAGLSVLLNKLEKPSVLACLRKCKESLEVPAMELLEPGMELLTNSGQSRCDNYSGHLCHGMQYDTDKRYKTSIQ